jgi:hypothetical protein
MLVPQWPNDRWSLDFASDQFIDGRRMRIQARCHMVSKQSDIGAVAAVRN